MTVSRVNTEQDVGQQMIQPAVCKPPGDDSGSHGNGPARPCSRYANLVFLIFTALLGGLAWYLMRRKEQTLVKEEISAAPPPIQETPEASGRCSAGRHAWFRGGASLDPLVDSRQKGELQDRIKRTREVCPGSGLPAARGAHSR